MLGKMNAKMEAFYNSKFKRDADLLNILKKKEAEKEANMLRKKLMKDRDQQLEEKSGWRTWT